MKIVRGWVAFGAMVSVLLVAGPASAAESGLGLEAEAGPGRFEAGKAVSLTLTVANQGTAECKLAVMPTGTVKIVSVTRDGVAVEPSFAEAAYQVSLAQQAVETASVLKPGEKISFGMGSSELGADWALSSVDGLPGGGGMLTLWPVSAPGKYQVSMRYRSPQTLGAQSCAGVSNEAVAEFTVGRGAGRPMWWFIAAGGAALLLVAGGVWFLMRRRRRGAAALAMVMAISLIAGVDGSKAAHADITPLGEPGEYLEMSLQLPGCLAIFRSPGGDPAGVMPVLDKKPGPPSVKIRPQRPGDYGDGFQGNNKQTSTIYWSPDKPVKLENNVMSEKCASLYHELAHAKEWHQTGKLDKRKCGKLVVETNEAAATLAENAYRTSHGLPARQSYSYQTLPKNMKECEDRPANQQKPPTECTPNTAKQAGATDCDHDLPPEPPGGGDSGMSNGDPHLVTFDRHSFGFQAVGEFVLTESGGGDLVIQARQAPVKDSRVASVNSAVAMKAGSDRLQLALVQGELRFWLNGEQQQWARGSQLLPGGAKAARRASPIPFAQDGYTVRWADGTRMWADVIGLSGLRLVISPAKARMGSLRGLLGDYDGSAANDMRPRGAQPMTLSLDRGKVYQEFGDTWRVSQAESLFLYGAAETTETFTDRGFPDQLISAAGLDPARRAFAEGICAGAGITDPFQLESCVIDVALTFDPAFAVNNADLQANPAISTPSGPATPGDTGGANWVSGPVRDGHVVTGTITVAGQAQRFDLDLAGGDDFFVADWRGPDRCDQSFSVNLVGVSNSNFPCTGQSARFLVPDRSKAYQLEIAALPAKTGTFGFTLITAKRRVVPIRVGDTVNPGSAQGTGTLEVRGRIDQLEFDPAGLTAVRLSGLPMCDANIVVDLLDVTSNRIVSAGRLLCGELAAFSFDDPSHRHALVVSSPDLKTGPYSLTLAPA